MTVQSVNGCRHNRGWMVTLMVAGFFCLPSLGWGQTHAQAAKELSKAFSEAAKAAVPAVVSIKVEKTITGPAVGFGGTDGFNDPLGQFPDDFLRRYFGDRLGRQQSPRKYREEGQGSGFIISEDGYILTNNHVVGDVDKITVELKDGRTFTNAKLIGTDPDSEVALIKIDGDHFPVLPLGDSSTIEVGDWVIAVGNPFGLSETVTVGVISAVGRNNMHITQYDDFIQTDAAINPGNSGGPLIDLDGRVIGINTAIVSQSGGYMGIGFAIPINMARTIGEQLKKHGKVSRGYLGLYAHDVDAEKAGLLGLKEATGVVVATIQNDSPAEKAGLKVHDVILSLNGKKIESYDSFRSEVAMLAPGAKVRLEVQRDGKILKLTVTLGDRDSSLAKEQNEKEPVAAEEPQRAFGLQVQDLTEDLADRLHYKAGEGVLISAVEPGSPAAEKGIQAGDLILSVNGHAVTSADEFKAAVKKAKENKVLLLVKRGDISQFVTIATE